MTDLIKSSFDQNGYYIFDQPVLAPDLLAAAREGMEMLREGGNDTGTPMDKSHWNPGDDPAALCKIDYPQIASTAMREFIGAPAIGELSLIHISEPTRPY